MKLVIDIPEEFYNHIKNDNVYYLEDGEESFNLVKNATPLTDCTDAISRSAVIEALNKIRENMRLNSEHFTNDDGEDCLAIYEDDAIAIVDKYNHMIYELPSVNPTTDLSKIRAEIAQKALEPDYQHDCEDWHVGLIMAEEIIDKYSKGGE